MSKVLSICIASYNKADITASLVRSILTCKNQEIEVVVVDNASTDNTIEILSEINDERFRYVENTENIGGARNLVKSLYTAKGLFCLYSNDRDIIYPNKLDEFVDFLKNNPEIGGGHCERIKNESKGKIIELRGVDALLTISFKGDHPTGFFFKRDILNTIPRASMEKYVDATPFTPFPYENIICEIICKGFTVVQYNDVIWCSTGNETHNKYVSGFVKLNEEGDRWFFPGNCLKRIIGNTEDTVRLCEENGIELTEEERYRLYAHLLDHQYRLGVYRYKAIYETPSLAAHYAVRCRKISRKETKQCKGAIVDGYLNYIRIKNGGYNEKEKYIFELVKNVDNIKRERPMIKYIYRILSGVKSLFK